MRENERFRWATHGSPIESTVNNDCWKKKEKTHRKSKKNSMIQIHLVGARVRIWANLKFRWSNVISSNLSQSALLQVSIDSSITWNSSLRIIELPPFICGPWPWESLRHTFVCWKRFDLLIAIIQYKFLYDFHDDLHLWVIRHLYIYLIWAEADLALSLLETKYSPRESWHWWRG